MLAWSRLSTPKAKQYKIYSHICVNEDSKLGSKRSITVLEEGIYGLSFYGGFLCRYVYIGLDKEIQSDISDLFVLKIMHLPNNQVHHLMSCTDPRLYGLQETL